MKKSFKWLLVLLVLECLVLVFNFESSNTDVVRQAIKSSLEETSNDCNPTKLERAFANFFGKSLCTQAMVLNFDRYNYNVLRIDGDWVILNYQNEKAVYLKNRPPFIFDLPKQKKE